MARARRTAAAAHAHGELVREMIDVLQSLLDGAHDRAAVTAWTRARWPPDSGQGSPFHHGDACAVFESIWNIEERDGDGHVVRAEDIVEYVRWLREGSCYHGDADPMISFTCADEELEARARGAVTRFWYAGLGWYRALRFASPDTGRPFAALAPMLPRANYCVHKRVTDDLDEAARDLFETLALDDADASYLAPEINLSSLPSWELLARDRGQLVVRRTRSYAKAIAALRGLEAEGRFGQLRPLPAGS